ncbi:MAG: holin [Clostridiales bacterium]|nr:holin [Clostridiales bacterium]
MKEFDKINMIYGAVAAVGVAIFGKYWFLFAGFLILNIVDYVTGYCKARFYNKNESSAIGAKGIFKKVWYWIVIGIAFFIATCFTYMGDIIGVDLGFVLLFGWFTLATYLVNEIRSILENLVEMNVNVPQFLIAGLEITQKLIDNQTEIKKEEKNRNE